MKAEKNPKEKVKSVVFIYALITIVSILLLSAICAYYLKNPIYAISQINLYKEDGNIYDIPSVITLPYCIYRYWDFVALLVYCVLSIAPFYSKNGEPDDEIVGYPLGVTIGFIFGALSCLSAANLITALLACLLFGLLISSIVNLITKKKFGVSLALGYSVGAGLTIGLLNIISLGLVIGLTISLVFALIITLLALLVRLIKPGKLKLDHNRYIH
ncbi:MAG: hypothetical protein ACOYL8_04675 [Patescibacteria group bacterium]